MIKSFTFALISLGLFLPGCPEPEANTPSDTEVMIQALIGSWSGELDCYEEGSTSSGTADLVLTQTDDTTLSGPITFAGSNPTDFTTRAVLELLVTDEGTLEGTWSECEIEGGLHADGNTQLSCHFWHQTQDSGFVLKPNQWQMNEDQTILQILENPQIESEAQKCHGALGKGGTQ